MKTQIHRSKPVIALLVFCYSLQTFAGPSSLGLLSQLTQEGKNNVREYFSSNPDNRFLVRVHVWGDVPLSGIHYVPDNATLLDVVGFAGGPTGTLSKSSLTLNRLPESRTGKAAQEIHVDGQDLTSAKYRDLRINNGDVIYMESAPRTDTLVRTLQIASVALAILSTSATLILLGRR